jgi:hypothetical protein
MADWLFPRLHRIGQNQLIEQLLKGVAVSRAVECMSAGKHLLSYAQSGGRRLPDEVWQEVRNGILEIARRCGFPASASQKDRALFDARAAAWLIECGTVPVGEALRDDVWGAVTCALVPDIVLWRFGEAHPDRLGGGVRNALQRLWIRAAALDRGPGHARRWELLEALTEDALVQITERPSICAEPRLARAIAEGWLRTSTRIGQAAMEPVMRRAIRRIRIRNEVVVLSLLPDAGLDLFIDECFATPAPVTSPVLTDQPQRPPREQVPVQVRQRFLGCMLGGAVGDALGAPVEFMKRHEILSRFGKDGITTYAPAYGRLGAITDDTQMTLFTAEGLLRSYVRGYHKGIIAIESMTAHACLRWLRTQGDKDAPHMASAMEEPGWLVGQAWRQDRPQESARRPCLRRDRGSPVAVPCGEGRSALPLLHLPPADAGPQAR